MTRTVIKLPDATRWELHDYLKKNGIFGSHADLKTYERKEYFKGIPSEGGIVLRTLEHVAKRLNLLKAISSMPPGKKITISHITRALRTMKVLAKPTPRPVTLTDAELRAEEDAIAAAAKAAADRQLSAVVPHELDEEVRNENEALRKRVDAQDEALRRMSHEIAELTRIIKALPDFLSKLETIEEMTSGLRSVMEGKKNTNGTRPQ